MPDDAEDHFRALEHMYVSAPVNRQYDTDLTVEEGAATVVLDVSEEDFHAAGALHGHVLFKILDDAVFFAANSLVTDVFVLTAGVDVDLVRPVTGGTVTAEAEVVHPGRTRMLAEGEVRNEEGKLVARGSASILRSEVELGPEVGYE